MLEVNRLGENIGAEILGADVRDLRESDFDLIYQTWLECGVIAVRDQHLTIAEFLRYSERFGPLHEHPSKMTRHADYPQLTVLGIDKFDADGNLIEAVYRRGGETWHTDGAYDAIPFKATQLYALAIPSTGGDTLFASMYDAYDALPPALRQRIEGLRGAFTYSKRTKHSNALLNEEDRNWTPIWHPLVSEHPETGRRRLYFDQGKIVCLEGLEDAESESIIEQLTAVMIQPHGQYRHRWRKGDVVIWDNRCCYHKAAADYPPHEDRIHWRVSIKPALDI
jgi:taurine dioxygenase